MTQNRAGRGYPKSALRRLGNPGRTKFAMRDGHMRWTGPKTGAYSEARSNISRIIPASCRPRNIGSLHITTRKPHRPNLAGERAGSGGGSGRHSPTGTPAYARRPDPGRTSPRIRRAARIRTAAAVSGLYAKRADSGREILPYIYIRVFIPPWPRPIRMSA